jgi:hypothetical protein
MCVNARAARRRPSLGVNVLVAEGSIGPGPAAARRSGRATPAVPDRHALDVHAVARVVRAWADCERDTWSGGFVLELDDGSRRYLEGYESDGWGPHSAASVVPMSAGNNLRNLSSTHCANLFGWREAPELAEYLRRVGASRPFTTSREE